MKMRKNWQDFERLVAAIHRIEGNGAKVTWDDKIEGRQFDVSLRFRFGMYDYLTVIECKNHQSQIPVGQVDAFITKSLDVNANKAVMVSSSGFQSGGIKVAQKHGIELLTLKQAEEFPEEVLVKGLTPAIHITEFKFYKETGEIFRELPEESNILNYLVNNIIIKTDSGDGSLNDYVENWISTSRIDENPYLQKIELPPSSKVRFPQEDRDIPIRFVEFSSQIVTAQIVDCGGIDPSLIPPSYSLENVITGETQTIKGKEIKEGFDTKLIPGNFYHSPTLGFNYYCEKIVGDDAEMFLVESYQHGNLIQAKITLKLEYSYNYVPIKNKNEIERLKKMLRRY